MKNESKRIGQIIKEARKARGMTQMELSELVGVSYQQVQKYEKGTDISVERLKQVAKALNAPITLFFASPDSVAETPAVYGKMSKEETALLQSYRRIKTKKTKKAVLEFLKTFAAE